MRRRATVALCGAGMVSAAHAATAALLGLPVLSVASRTPERAREVARRVGGRPATFDTLAIDADLVVVATPPSRHLLDARSALDHGAAVLVEKPLCTTLADADELVALSERHGNRLMYADNVIHAPVMQEFIRRIPALGPLRDLEVRIVNPAPSWRTPLRSDWGGGVLLDLGVQAFAIAVLAAAPAVPRSVEATLQHAGADDVDDHADVTIVFSNGLRARIVVSYRASGVAQWEAQAAGADGVVRAELAPRPTLELDGIEVALPRVSGKLEALDRSGYRGEWMQFLDDLAAHRRPASDAAFGRMMLDLVCSAAAAARSGVAQASPFTGSRSSTPYELAAV